ncbi:MAG: hypothetical protein HUK03_04055, partial [Bacteroidaceae bacterium]|nr:hypothetical protein [Bacteroidaceae bacterium]
MFRKTKYFVLAAFLLLATSCYKLISISAPTTVEAGATFEVRMALADDGDDNQKFALDWSMAGIRVPQGWTVTMPEGAHQQYAEDWVYYEDGTQVSSRQNMVEDEFLTELYNEAAPRSGYTWKAFTTPDRVGKFMSACWRNGCDSIVVTFQVTVPADTKPGTYTLDFLAGDEEDAKGVYKYADYASTSGSRLFHAGTVTSLSGNRRVDNANTALRRTITVVEPSGVHTPTAATTTSERAYDTAGRIATPQTKRGIYIVGGKKV